MRWQRIVIGLGKSRHCQTWLERRFSWNVNLQGSKNWTAKSTILKETGEKVESVFVTRSAQWAEKLGCCLDYCRGWKLRSENLRLQSTWRPFDSSFEQKGALVTVEICVLCGRWFSNQFDLVSETPFSCDTVGRELLWAVVSRTLLAAVPWNELEHLHRKARLCVYLIILILRSDVLMFRILNINQCVKNFLRLRKVEFIKWINLINVLFIGFVKQGFSAYHCVIIVQSLDCWLLENCSRAIF